MAQTTARALKKAVKACAFVTPAPDSPVKFSDGFNKEKDALIRSVRRRRRAASALRDVSVFAILAFLLSVWVYIGGNSNLLRSADDYIYPANQSGNTQFEMYNWLPNTLPESYITGDDYTQPNQSTLNPFVRHPRWIGTDYDVLLLADSTVYPIMEAFYLPYWIEPRWIRREPQHEPSVGLLVNTRFIDVDDIFRRSVLVYNHAFLDYGTFEPIQSGDVFINGENGMVTIDVESVTLHWVYKNISHTLISRDERIDLDTLIRIAESIAPVSGWRVGVGFLNVVDISGGEPSEHHRHQIVGEFRTETDD
jgi:hypothetical protein